MQRLAVLFLSLLLPSLTHADVFKTEAEIQPFIEKTMQLVGKGEVNKAFEAMKPYAAVPAAEFDSFSLGSKAQRDQFTTRYGKTVGQEFISKKKLGESLIRIIYIEKTEKNALPWTFYFYKGQEGWTLNSFNWNDQTAPLFFLE